MVDKFPASLLKFDACTEIQNSISDAVNIVKTRGLAFGQPAVVPIKTADASVFDLLFAVGNISGNPAGIVLHDVSTLLS